MSHALARVRVYNPQDRSKYMDLDLLVDTGSTYTWIKRDNLEGLGLKPSGKRKFRTIDNRVVEREICEVVVGCLGRSATTVVVFAEKDDNEVLGLHALGG